MATFILIPGAGGVAWYWHRVVPLLQAAGHEAIAVNLPGDDERAGLSTYADRVVTAIHRRADVVLVAQSLGGFTAPLVCARTRIRMLVFVNAMIPVPGGTAGDWWEHTGSIAARTAAARRQGYAVRFDPPTYFLHDVPPEIVQQGEPRVRDQAERVSAEPCGFEKWPEVPIHVIAGREDRFFPIAFQRRVARNRLKAKVDEVPGGHLVALSNPQGVVDLLLAYLRHPRRSKQKPGREPKT